MQQQQTEPLATSLSDEPRLYGVLATHIDMVWHEVKPYLLQALDYADGKYDIDDIYQYLINRDMQLWVAYDNTQLLSFAITQIIVFPRQKRLAIPFVGGVDMFKWLRFYETLAEFGKSQGCTLVEGYARPGWEKVLAKYGFKKIYSIITAPI